MHTIATIVDEKFFKYITPWLNSVVKNYPAYPHILIYYANLDEGQLKYLSGFDRVSLREVNLKNDAIGPTTYRMSKRTYAKYLYFLDSAYDKILHIDPDCLVLKPLDELFSYDDFFSVICINTTTFRKPKSFFRKIAFKVELLQDGLVQNSKYIMNAGVLLIPRKYRTKENYDYLAYLTKKYFRYLKHWDQSVINMWMWKHRIRPTDKIEYNYQARFIEMPERKMPLSDVCILHFVGAKKPDSEWSRQRYSKEIIDLYDYYCNME